MVKRIMRINPLKGSRIDICSQASRGGINYSSLNL
jgi:hypothetical protein